MKILYSLLAIWTSMHAAPVESFQKFRLTGLASDVHSGATLDGVSFYALHENRRTLLSSSDSKGFFSFDLQTESAAIVIEKKGYRTIKTRVASYRNAGKKNDFFIKIPLIPLDQQAKDAPYMQSEQKEYKLADEKRKFTIARTFVISDALNGAPVRRGTLCFDFTKDGRKECKDLSSDPVMSFKEADIVGFTVNADGYQSYTGNLILEKMDEKPGRYEVKLAPELTMLSLNVTGNKSVANCRLTSDTGTDQLLASSAKESYMALAREGNYALRVYNGERGLLYSEKIAVKKGLNFLGIAIRSNAAVIRDTTKEKPKEQAAPRVVLDTLQPITIYFQQSGYTYSAGEKNKLDALVSLLKADPQKKVRIVGHTDNVGDPQKNIMLSEQRARVIRFYLLSRSVRENQIFFTGVGGKFPIRKNDSEENKKMNRRVEISMVY